jgi:hypothetical protein
MARKATTPARARTTGIPTPRPTPSPIFNESEFEPESEFEFEPEPEPEPELEFLGGGDVVFEEGDVSEWVTDVVGDEVLAVELTTGARTTVPTGTENQLDEEQHAAASGSQQ